MTPPKECPHPKILDPVTGLLGLSKETLQVWWIYDLRWKKSSELSRDAQGDHRIFKEEKQEGSEWEKMWDQKQKRMHCDCWFEEERGLQSKECKHSLEATNGQQRLRSPWELSEAMRSCLGIFNFWPQKWEIKTFSLKP